MNIFHDNAIVRKYEKMQIYMIIHTNFDLTKFSKHFFFTKGMHHVPRITRLLALWSLSTSGMIKPQSVEPIFYSIYANPAEHTELRIAAFNVLIKLNPPMAVFHKIAQRLVLQYYEK